MISNNSLLSLRSDIEIEYIVEKAYHNSYGLMDDYQNFFTFKILVIIFLHSILRLAKRQFYNLGVRDEN